MAYGESNGHVTDDVTSISWPHTLRAQCLANSWICYYNNRFTR